MIPELVAHALACDFLAHANQNHRLKPVPRRNPNQRLKPVPLMQRRRRSGTADTEGEVAALSLDQLDAEIRRCLQGFERAGSSQGGKAFFKRLVWLEKAREKLHGIPATRRLWRSR